MNPDARIDDARIDDPRINLAALSQSALEAWALESARMMQAAESRWIVTNHGTLEHLAALKEVFRLRGERGEIWHEQARRRPIVRRYHDGNQAIVSVI